LQRLEETEMAVGMTSSVGRLELDQEVEVAYFGLAPPTLPSQTSRGDAPEGTAERLHVASVLFYLRYRGPSPSTIG
jgi:hypothetical protein